MNTKHIWCRREVSWKKRPAISDLTEEFPFLVTKLSPYFNR
jgi:hypothetical protein